MNLGESAETHTAARIRNRNPGKIGISRPISPSRVKATAARRRAVRLSILRFPGELFAGSDTKHDATVVP